jgi:putative DNA primase/helicase
LGDLASRQLIPFNVKFESFLENPEAKHLKDPKLKEKLLEELPGILNWIIDGAREWYEHGLIEPDSVRNATRQYCSEQDILKAFLEECCIRSGTVRMKDLFARFREWATGEREAWSQRKFADQLRERRFETRRDMHGILVLELSLPS